MPAVFLEENISMYKTNLRENLALIHCIKQGVLDAPCPPSLSENGFKQTVSGWGMLAID